MSTLRRRLLTTILAWMVLVLVIVVASVFALARQNLVGDMDQFVHDKAFILGQQVNPWHPSGIVYNEKAWQSDRYTVFAQTFDADWNLLFKSARLSAPIPPTAELKRYASHPLGVVVSDAVGPDGQRYRMGTVRMERDGKFICFAQAGVLVSERDAALRRLAVWLIGCSMAALALAWVGSDYLIRQWEAPLTALSDSARKVHPGNVARQRLFAPRNAPELVQLATSFNELLDRVEVAQASQLRFVADASHELRTPLTILRGEIEVALRRPRSPDEYAEVLQSSREEIERLSRLTDNLLTLARADAGDLSGHREPVDLIGIARDCCRKLSPLSEQRRVVLKFEPPPSEGSATVSGDGVAFEQVIRNLVENALRHTPSGEGVTVRIALVDCDVLLEVEDCGIGIGSEHLPHLFERFYRVDKARSREYGGAGLGLAIVRSLVEAHRGTVEVRSEIGKGTTFTVRLPRA